MKEQSHGQPKGKSKGKGKDKKKHPGKGMDSARWVILVQNVRELNLSVMSKRMMIGSSSLCVLRSKVQECYDGFDGTAEFVEESL